MSLTAAPVDVLWAQTPVDTATTQIADPNAAGANEGGIGGPSSVGAQLGKDETGDEESAEGRPADTLFDAIDRAKDRLARDYGLALGTDYTVFLQHTSAGLADKDAVGGVARFYGKWTLVNRGTTDAGALVFKVDNRHRIGTPIAPADLGLATGYDGITGLGFTDAGTLLTNLYWEQALADRRFAFVAGIVDVTDYVDVYALVNNWTDFGNLAFNTDPTIPAPSQGLGAAALWNITDHFYLLGGLADANGDPSDPGNAINIFFNTHEFFKHIELGWISSWENRTTDNIHVTAWQVDARQATGVDDGWGVAVSVSRTFDERWTPFFRAGYSDGGGAILERSVSLGLGYRVNDRNDYFGFGANWGRPPKDPTVWDVDDQVTFEAFYRLQLLPQLAITPDVQFVLNPADNPSADSLWFFGLRIRAAL